MALERNGRNSKPKRCFLCTIAICTMALLILIGASTFPWANNRHTDQVCTQELNHPFSTILAYNDAMFTAPATALAGRAILSNKVEMVSKYHFSFRCRLSPEYATLAEHQPELAFLV